MKSEIKKLEKFHEDLAEMVGLMLDEDYAYSGGLYSECIGGLYKYGEDILDKHADALDFFNSLAGFSKIVLFLPHAGDEFLSILGEDNFLFDDSRGYLQEEIIERADFVSRIIAELKEELKETKQKRKKLFTTKEDYTINNMHKNTELVEALIAKIKGETK